MIPQPTARGSVLFGAAATLGLWLALSAAIAQSTPPAAPPTAPQATACGPDSCAETILSRTGLETLLLARLGPGLGLSLGFSVRGVNADRSRPIALRLDGKAAAILRPATDYASVDRPETFWIVQPDLLAGLLPKLARATSLRLEYLDLLGAPHDADFDLPDLAARLGRLDIGPVEAPRATVPEKVAGFTPPTRFDEIRRLGPPSRLLEMHARMTTCEALDSPRLATVKPVIAPLPPTAMLYALPCAAQRDSVSYRLWAVDFGEIGGIQPLYFALHQPARGWIGSDLLPNVGFDEREARLTARGTPAGGCAFEGRWRWTSHAFLMEDFVTGPCPGQKTPVRVFPAK